MLQRCDITTRILIMACSRKSAIGGPASLLLCHHHLQLESLSLLLLSSAGPLAPIPNPLVICWRKGTVYLATGQLQYDCELEVRPVDVLLAVC